MASSTSPPPRSTTLTEPVHLAVWHGVNLPLVLSLVALVGGAIVYAAGPAVARVLRLGTAVPSAADGYRETLRGVNASANRATAIAQPGSLPLYLGIILFTAMVVPGVLLLSGDWWTGWPQARGDPRPRRAVGAAHRRARWRRRSCAADSPVPSSSAWSAT